MENPNTITTQVIIAGAGPTGLSLAAQLLRHNVDFIIIEKNNTTTLLSKALVVQARTLEIFRELGIADEALDRGKMTTELRLFYKGKQKADINLAGLGEGISEFAFALSLEQSKTEKLLAEYIYKNGKKVQWACGITHFEQHDNGVTVYCKDEHENERIIEAAYLVGCDGAGSMVRHQLNLPFKGSTEPKLFYVADVIITSPVINKNVLYMYMIPKGFVLFFPMEGTRHYRVIGILPGAENNVEYTFAEIEPFIKQQIISPIGFEKLQWFSTYKVHSRKASSFMQGRCFIAGDAAHIHTPAGGQGMNTGIQDAYNLAWKLAYTLRGEVNAEVLKTYDTERSANAKRLLQTTDRMFDVMSGANRFWNFLRLGFFPFFISIVAKSKLAKRRFFPLISQTGISYGGSYLTLQSSVGKVKAGDRMHYFIFTNGKQIFSYLTEPVFKLLYFGSNVVSNPLSHVKLKIAFFSFREIPAAVFGAATDFYILLRPDNHISYIGKDVVKCKEFVSKLLR